MERAEQAGEAIARDVLARLQAGADGRSLDTLLDSFDPGDESVLVGTAGVGIGPSGLRDYLTAVVTGAGALRWEWQRVHVFLDTPSAVGFAAFGDIVVTDGSSESRAPIRLTAVAVPTGTGWRLRQFHGSIPSDW